MFQSSPSPLLKMETFRFTNISLTRQISLSRQSSSSDVSLASPDLNLIPWEREFVTLPLDQTKQLKILVSLATNTKPSIVRPIASELAIIKSRALLFSGCPAQAWACQIEHMLYHRWSCAGSCEPSEFISQHFLSKPTLDPYVPIISLPLAQDGDIAFYQHISDPPNITIKTKSPPVTPAWPAQIWTLFPESESLLLYP